MKDSEYSDQTVILWYFDKYHGTERLPYSYHIGVVTWHFKVKKKIIMNKKNAELLYYINV